MIAPARQSRWQPLGTVRTDSGKVLTAERSGKVYRFTGRGFSSPIVMAWRDICPAVRQQIEGLGAERMSGGPNANERTA